MKISKLRWIIAFMLFLATAVNYANRQALAAVSDRIRNEFAMTEQVKTLIYDAAPAGFHDWGVTAAWNIAHGTTGLPALFHDWPQAAKALETDTVAYATRDADTKKLVFQIHSPH